ncbi:protease [Lithospermum erythrorhizon]|uniref:Protease n=1 Tax=Lithospermum erythrorhizon TaxID=34254 RepID=A0AAV3R8E0_LITER
MKLYSRGARGHYELAEHEKKTPVVFLQLVVIMRRLWSLRSMGLAKRLSSPPYGNRVAGRFLSQGHKAGTYIPALLAGVIGIGLIDVAYADANEMSGKNPEYSELEEIARKERVRLQELLLKKGTEQGFCPRFTIAVKGQKVTIRFQIPPGCEIPRIISNLVSHLGLADNHGAGSNMILRAWDSGVAWQLTLSRPQNETVGSQMQNKEINRDNEDLCILMFRPLINSDKAELEFMKQGSLTEDELEALASVLQLAGEQKGSESRSRRSAPQVSSAEKTISSLEAMGVKIYGVDEPVFESSKSEISWDNIAGYNQQKREIEDTILLALQSPEIYDDIARGTRCKFETNRPRAVLFEGPPGTGKTSSARVIANQAGVPLVYVPLEVIMSKYYGESERMLGKVFSLVNELPNGAIVFLDEVDSLAVARDGETHEATRRLLSVLLRQGLSPFSL